MKKQITYMLLLCSLCAQAQVHSNGQVWVSTGSLVSYDAPDIWPLAAYNAITETVRIECSIVNPIISATGELPEAKFILVATKAEIDAFTGAGSTETDQFHDCVLQFVKDYLEGISENSGVTFSL